MRHVFILGASGNIAKHVIDILIRDEFRAVANCDGIRNCKLPPSMA